MSDDDGGSVLVFRDKSGQPVPVPEEIVEEASRTYRAYVDRIGGKSWGQIAEAHGYLNADAARYDVNEYMARAKALVEDTNRRELLSTQYQRHEALLAAIWPQAMQGHLPAVNAAVGVLAQQSKLLKLDDETLDESKGGPRTVIVPVDDEGYRQILEEAAKGV